MGGCVLTGGGCFTGTRRGCQVLEPFEQFAHAEVVVGAAEEHWRHVPFQIRIEIEGGTQSARHRYFIAQRLEGPRFHQCGELWIRETFAGDTLYAVSTPLMKWPINERVGALRLQLDGYKNIDPNAAEFADSKAEQKVLSLDLTVLMPRKN